MNGNLPFPSFTFPFLTPLQQPISPPLTKTQSSATFDKNQPSTAYISSPPAQAGNPTIDKEQFPSGTPTTHAHQSPRASYKNHQHQTSKPRFFPSFYAHKVNNGATRLYWFGSMHYPQASNYRVQPPKKPYSKKSSYSDSDFNAPTQPSILGSSPPSLKKLPPHQQPSRPPCRPSHLSLVFTHPPAHLALIVPSH